jgi:hypothetical protein
MTGHCAVHADCVLADIGSCLDIEAGSRLLKGTVSRRCEVAGFEVPDSVEKILRKLGVPFFYL